MNPSLSISGLRFESDPARAGDPRKLIAWASALGFASIQLDAALAGIRPRELDRSARKDLAALLRRGGLALSGLDLWIPPSHWTNPQHTDRAVAAATSALELAAELAQLTQSPAGRVLCLEWPEAPPAGAVAQLANAAQSHGVTIADFRFPITPRPELIGVGIDPAAILAAGANVFDAVARLKSAPAAAHLSDLDAAGRCTPGRGRLDLQSYQVALATVGFTARLVLDLRGLPDADAAAKAALSL